MCVRERLQFMWFSANDYRQCLSCESAYHFFIGASHRRIICPPRLPEPPLRAPSAHPLSSSSPATSDKYLTAVRACGHPRNRARRGRVRFIALNNATIDIVVPFRETSISHCARARARTSSNRADANFRIYRNYASLCASTFRGALHTSGWLHIGPPRYIDLIPLSPPLLRSFPHPRLVDFA